MTMIKKRFLDRDSSLSIQYGEGNLVDNLWKNSKFY